MIKLTDKLPQIDVISAEFLKIKCLYECYPKSNDVLFWVQDDDKAVISFTDGNMIIYNNNADIEELLEFVSVINPVCIFSDIETLTSINKTPPEVINVMYRKADIEEEYKGDTLSSKELYELLDVDGLSLPEYPYFAVDYCRRLNMGIANYFAVKGKGACITFNAGNQAIINGLASREKGFGTTALRAVLNKNYGRDFLVCCRDKVKGFYQKNGFEKIYSAGYWVRYK